MPRQYTLTSTFQISLVAAIECAVPNTSGSQQIATSTVYQSSESRQPPSLTKTRLLQTAGAKFEIDVLHSDTGANSSDASAIEMSAAESSLQQKSYTRTAVAPAKAMVQHQSAADKSAESKWKRGGKKQSNGPRISSTEMEVTVSNASSHPNLGRLSVQKL